jgi:TonB family protein
MSEVWTQLERQLVNGELPLHRCLGSSDHSGVFLTEYAAQNLARAALKLVPAIPTLAESQLSHWSAAAAVAHPQLIRLFETGRCQLGGLHYLYVAMEYAEQNLAQLLVHRPLTEVEVREMLPPILDALAYLHSRDLVQGQLKPSNILVIDNQLKLASDTIRPAGEATASIGTLSIYNPPEARDGSFSTSGDIWALGVTLCLALTQRPPSRSGERGESVALPTDFPVAFIDVVRRCLARNPAQRPSVADLQAWANRGFPERLVAAPAPTAVAKPPETEGPTRLVIRAVLKSEPAPEEPLERKSSALPILAGVAILAIGGAAAYWYMSHSNSTASTAGSQPTGAPVGPAPSTSASASAPADLAPPSAPPAPGARPLPSAPATSGAPPSNTNSPPTRSPAAGSRPANAKPASSSAVLHEEIPSVSLRSRQTIHGHVRVAVRVTVDNSGAVISDVLENPGPSKYFARIAGEAASKWKFAPSGDKASRQWVIHFEFSRDGTNAHAIERD